MRIVSMEILEHLVLQVGFEDGTTLEVRFGQDSLVGLLAGWTDPAVFARASLASGTVVWASGYALDAELARIKADEGSVWRPRRS